MNDGTLVVAFTFGWVNRKTGDPATLESNIAIGNAAFLAAKEHDCAVYAQDGVSVVGVNVIQPYCYYQKVPSTYEVARGAAWVISQRRIKEVYIACAPAHAARCLRDMCMAIADQDPVLASEVVVKIVAIDGANKVRWFSPASTQWYTRWETVFTIRERILGFLFAVLGDGTYKWLTSR